MFHFGDDHGWVRGQRAYGAALAKAKMGQSLRQLDPRAIGTDFVPKVYRRLLASTSNGSALAIGSPLTATVEYRLVS